MILIVAQCIYFMLPAYFANMAPIISKNWLNFLAVPVDFNIKIKGKELLGKNKTLRGFVFGVLFAIITAYLQYLAYSYGVFNWLSFADYREWLLIGLMLGFGALLGDSAKSFFKRRLGIKPGERFIPWDQLDFVIGSLILASFFVKLDMSKVIVILIISFIGHIIVNHSAYYLGIRKERW